MLSLALRSLRHRRITTGLTVVSIALAVALLLGVERIRTEAREGFAGTLSGTDLIVGARTSPVHLLLATAFRIGTPANTMSWAAFEAVAARPEVRWAVPISLGDSYRGFRVMGTTPAYFEHFRYARGRALRFAEGGIPKGAGDAVLGAEVARRIGARIGLPLVVAHGTGDVAFVEHAEHPFRVAGVLEPTGTPVDHTLHVLLEGLDALHAGIAPATNDDPLAAALHSRSSTVPPIRSITACLVGLRSRQAALGVQRALNEAPGEALTAVLPAVTLQEVWEVLGVAERTLLAVSALVVMVGLGSMLVALLTSLGERRREMAILRAVGARPVHVFALILGEAAGLTVLGTAAGAALAYGGMAIGRPWIAQRFGVLVQGGLPTMRELEWMAWVCVAGVLAGLLPAWRCYRNSLADGLRLRL